jgi:uncharacterized protein YkwD
MALVCALVGLGMMAATARASGLDETSAQAMKYLSEMRAQYGLGAVVPDARLAARCSEWLHEMLQSGGMYHDPKVYGTPERENLAGGANYPITVERSMRMWEGSPGHAASMFDQGFPTARYGGYAEYRGFSCLRLCPSMRAGGQGPCS